MPAAANSLHPELATAWQRLMANVTDVLLIIVFHLAARGAAILFLPHPSSFFDHLVWASPLSVWLGIWLCWTLWGATPGKMFWRLKIVDMQGKQLSLPQAAVRCLGYIIASWPLKLGFVSILWDPLRQGWHDRLAGTLVVRVPVPEGWQPPKRPPRSPLLLPQPAIRFALKHSGAPAVAYAVLSLVMTWPLIIHISEARPGAAGDGSNFMWNYWHFKFCLEHGLPLSYSHYIFYPQGVSLLYHTMQWLYCFLAWPLQNWLGLIAAYNVLLLFSLASSAWALYFLATSLCRNPLCGFAAGLAFGFSPYFLVGHIEHQNLLAAQFLPFLALWIYALMLSGRTRYALLGGVTFALIGLCDFYYLLFGLLIAIVVAIGVCVSQGISRLLLLRLGMLVTSVLIGLLMLGPLLMPMIFLRGTGQGMDVSTGGARAAFSADLLAYVTPNLSHSLIGRSLWPKPFEILCVGLALLAWALIGIIRQCRSLYPWLLLLVVATIISLGPNIHIGRRDAFPGLLLLLCGGLPGNGFDRPWRTDHIQTLSHQLLARPSMAWRDQKCIPSPIPWQQILRVCPWLRPLKCPGRFGLLSIMCLAVCAAMALSALSHFWRRQGRCYLPYFISLGVVGATLAEYAVVPLPMYYVHIHPFYEQIATDGSPYAIVEAPFLMDYSEYQLYQTVHHKYLFNGHLARLVGQPDAFWRSFLLFQYLSIQPPRILNAGPSLWLSQIPEEAWHSPPVQKRLCQEIEILSHLHTRYLLLHRELLSPQDYVMACKMLKMLENALGLRLLYTDNQLAIYVLPGRSLAQRSSIR